MNYWVLAAGGLMALAWLLILIGIAGAGGDAIGTGAMLMIGVAIWWRIMRGRQVPHRLRAMITGAMDSVTDSRVEAEQNRQIGREIAKQVNPAVITPDMNMGLGTTGKRLSGWAWKRQLLMWAGAIMCVINPMIAATRELLGARAQAGGLAPAPAGEPDASGAVHDSDDGVDMDHWVATGQARPKDHQ